ncbi:MAG: type II toxin-antitoxin system RelB/DinJ family antitoxin [Selenomonadaceae bacterium]|nr:type II toxin-antitoxin system RelB/DinJ family antitoxin [Selenomonadaceae bacterium]MDD7055548.1 type II toxin-antitoxin system RelB/DinJ family antitoxin [Selenomonadaceae bacterium]
MAQATLSVRLDTVDKEYFEQFCRTAGLTCSTAVNMFVKAVIRERKLPFTVQGDPFYSQANTDHIHRSIAELDAGHGARMRGSLAKYANPTLMRQEKSAWADAAEEKYGNP